MTIGGPKNTARILAFLAVLGGVGCRSTDAHVPTAAVRAGLAPCNSPELPKDALCGTHEVFEDRAAKTGRKLALRVVVLPATGSQPLRDPFAYFAGGPGDSSIAEGAMAARQLASLRAQRDVLLVDYRGTGQSGGLFCSELADMDTQAVLDDFLPTDEARACRDRLMKEVDLSWYTTSAAVDDIEEVRGAFGYGPLNLMGTSYGSRAVLTYLRRHPQSVRTATLVGALPPSSRSLLNAARASQEALDGLIAECAGDAACRNAFPNLRGEVEAVLRRAATDPVQLQVLDRHAGVTSLRLTSSAVAQTLRYMLYSPVEAALLPLQIHQAAQGDWKPLARSAALHGSGVKQMAAGYFQSVSCAEEVASIRDDEIAAAVADTFLGDFRIRRQKAACEGWPIRDLEADAQAPVVSDVPVLLIAGERDPTTPPSYGEQAVRTLTNARQVVIPDGGHDTFGMGGGDCLPRMTAAFIESGTTTGLDTACVAAMRRPDFELPETAVAKADLQGLPGSYAASEMPMVVRVAFAGDRLRLTVVEGPTLPAAALVPTSPTRFRCEGAGLAPGLAVTFEMKAGKATRLNVLQPGMQPVALERTD